MMRFRGDALRLAMYIVWLFLFRHLVTVRYISKNFGFAWNLATTINDHVDDRNHDRNDPLLRQPQNITICCADDQDALPEEPTFKLYDADEDDDTPLDRLQMFVLCAARVLDPIAFFVLFPFINKMIWEVTGVEQSEVGFYSGIIESVYSLTQTAVMMPWGIASDRIGRKPVLVTSLIGTGLATGLFGFSRTVWQMVMFRSLAGLFASGSVVTLRTLVSEKSTKRTQARAFSLLAFAANVGIFVGPFFGGALSNPATQYPSIFGWFDILADYPYLLPCGISGAIGLLAALLNAAFLTETRVKRPPGMTATKPMSTKALLKSPGVMKVLFIYSHVFFLGMGYMAILPVFWFTPASLGGLGFTPAQISMFLAAGAVGQAIWLLLVFPPLHARIGTRRVLKVCAVGWPVVLLSGPYLNEALVHLSTEVFWGLAVFSVFATSITSMAYTVCQLALNDVSPSPEVLGMLNGVALSAYSATRTFTPALSASIFAFGVKNQILGGYLAWVVLFVASLGLWGTVSGFPDQVSRASGRKSPNTDIL